MTKDFANFTQAAAALANAVATLEVDVVISLISPVGATPDIFGSAISERLHCEVAVVQNTLEINKLVEELRPFTPDKKVLVVAPGVETGQQAHALATALNELGIKQRSLAVPVCPRAVLGSLQLVYQEVIALKTPLAPRSLAWHYEAMS